MGGSLPVYCGFLLGLLGLGLMVRPSRWLRVPTRRRALGVAATGGLIGLIGLALPVREQRAAVMATRLDGFVPAWQFREVHSIRIAAPPTAVYQAILRVRADEIFLFRTLTWLRRGGRPLPPGILNAGTRESLIDVATGGGFLRLVDSAPHELVIGTVVMAPPGGRGTVSPAVFQGPPLPGYVLAAMNFRVTPDAAGGSMVSTETRVIAGGPAARRRFAAYWRVIYPGSALIRRMWLKAIRQRAVDSSAATASMGVS